MTQSYLLTLDLDEDEFTHRNDSTIDDISHALENHDFDVVSINLSATAVAPQPVVPPIPGTQQTTQPQQPNA